MVGILVAIALVAGLMFFAGSRDRNDQAQLPDPARDRAGAGRPDAHSGHSAAPGPAGRAQRHPGARDPAPVSPKG